MGFYFEMQPASEREYKEGPPPPVFWTLYGILGFALACMTGAAFTLLRGLAEKGSAFDSFLFYSFLSTWPLYLLLGVRLLWVRKFIVLGADSVCWGFRVGRRTVFVREIPRSEIQDVRFASRVPTPNMAPQIHEDTQYYFQGHWRVGVYLKSGRIILLDKHTEREALEDLVESLRRWLGLAET